MVKAVSGQAPANNNPIDVPSKNTPIEAAPTQAFKSSNPSSLLKFFESSQSPANRHAEAHLKAQVEQDAAKILEVGEEWGRDDYSARLKAFSQALSKNGPEYDKKLMGELLNKDPEALDYWMSPALINQATENGDISQAQRTEMAETFATLYNEGHPALAPKLTEGDWFKSDTIESSLDQHLFNFRGFFDYQHSDVDSTQSVHRVDSFLGFMHSSQGPEATKFKKNYSQHLINHYTLMPRRGEPTRTSVQGHRSIAAGISAHLLADTPEPDTTTEFFSKYSPKQREYIFAKMESNDAWLSDKKLKTESRHKSNTHSLHDSLSQVMSAIAKSDSPQADQLTSELSQQMVANEKFWLTPTRFNPESSRTETNPTYIERINAMGAMLEHHTKPILDNFTNHNEISLGNRSGYTERQYHEDTRNLGRLFKHTLLSDDCKNAKEIGKQVINYSQELKSEINSAGDIGHDKPSNRLAILSAAIDEGVSQGYEELRQEQAQQTQLISFTIDFALSAIPASSKLSENIKEGLKNLPKNKINEAVEGLGKFAIDKSTGHLTNEAKNKLNELIGSDQTNLIAQGKYRDSLRESLFSGFEHDVRKQNVRNRSDIILNGLEDMRN